MKYLTFFTIFFLTAFNCVSQNCVQIDEGSLREIEFFDVYLSKSDVKFDSVIIFDYSFTRKGKIRDSTYMGRAALTLKSDTSGKYVYSYDSLQREFQRFEIKDGIKILNSENQYDSRGNLITWTWFTREGKVHSKTFYEYDSLNNLIWSNKYTGYWYLTKPELENRIEYKYSNGKLIETVKFYAQKSDGTWSEVWTTRYDSLSRQVFYKDQWGKSFFYQYSVYNDAGLLSKETIEGNEREKSVKEYTYNRFGLPEQLFWYYPDRKKDRRIRLTKYFYK